MKLPFLILLLISTLGLGCSTKSTMEVQPSEPITLDELQPFGDTLVTLLSQAQPKLYREDYNGEAAYSHAREQLIEAKEHYWDGYWDEAFYAALIRPYSQYEVLQDNNPQFLHTVLYGLATEHLSVKNGSSSNVALIKSEIKADGGHLILRNTLNFTVGYAEIWVVKREGRLKVRDVFIHNQYQWNSHSAVLAIMENETYLSEPSSYRIPTIEGLIEVSESKFHEYHSLVSKLEYAEEIAYSPKEYLEILDKKLAISGDSAAYFMEMMSKVLDGKLDRSVLSRLPNRMPDPSLAIHAELLDIYHQNFEFSDAPLAHQLDSLARSLEATLGATDPALSYFKALPHLANSDCDSARPFLYDFPQRLHHLPPGYTKLYQHQIQCAIEKGDFEQVTTTLRMALRNLDDPARIYDFSAHPDYLSSPPFKSLTNEYDMDYLVDLFMN